MISHEVDSGTNKKVRTASDSFHNTLVDTEQMVAIRFLDKKGEHVHFIL